jgi:hypothetical protein
MARSVFASLCLRARRYGAKRLTFSASLFEEERGAGIVGDWTCIGGDEYGRESVGIAHGRTGEEALRFLVEQLETRNA